MTKKYAYCIIALVGIIALGEIPLVAYLEYFYTSYQPVEWHHVDSSSRKQNSRVITTFPDDLQIDKELAEHLKNASENKIILIWAPSFGQKPERHIDRKQCGQCEVVYDREMIHDERTAAVVYHAMDINKMPETRYQHQLHIFWVMEASANLMYRRFFPTTESSYEFNATMTYRLDSDFLASYQSPSIGYSLMGKNVSIFDDIMNMKSKLAIAIVSDCSILPGARIRLTKIKELRSIGLRIDTFGWCFSTRLSRDGTASTIKKYKFYFAYENSYHCRDYITEKFFSNAFANNAVPVVWGAVKEDYESISPPDSFIFAEDFSTPQKLVDYLNFLDRNDKEYIKYFRWRTMAPTLLPQLKRARDFCALCRGLHGINVDDRYKSGYVDSGAPLFTDGIKPRTVPSLLYWLYAEDNPECFQLV